MLEQLFKPKSIAIVGASSDSLKVGNIILRNIASSFSGKIYPVNNKSAEISGNCISGNNNYNKVNLALDISQIFISGIPGYFRTFIINRINFSRER